MSVCTGERTVQLISTKFTSDISYEAILVALKTPA